MTRVKTERLRRVERKVNETENVVLVSWPGRPGLHYGPQVFATEEEAEAILSKQFGHRVKVVTLCVTWEELPSTIQRERKTSDVSYGRA